MRFFVFNDYLHSSIIENRQNVQQQSIVVTQKKTTTFKRSRHSLAMTPLTRQVMTKSIHRAILEYQQSHHPAPSSPKSPLDLRVRSTITRNSKDINQSTNKNYQQSSKSIEHSHISPSKIFKSNSLDSNSRTSALETVYEQEKDAKTDEQDISRHGNDVTSNSYAIVEVSADNEIIVNGPIASDLIGETPVLVSRKLSSEKLCAVDNCDSEIWYTPKEYVQSRVVENIEVGYFIGIGLFTPPEKIRRNDFFKVADGVKNHFTGEPSKETFTDFSSTLLCQKKFH